MMKRTALILAAILLLSVVAGCASSAPEASAPAPESKADSNAAPAPAAPEVPSEPVKLVIWGGVPEENGPQASVDLFNAAHDNIQVEYIRYVNDDQGNVKLDTALISGEKIDVFISYGPDRLEKRRGAGVTAELSDLCKQYDVDLIRDFGQAAQSNITEDGKIYAIPTYKQVIFMMLNKEMFEEVGIPIPLKWTWDEARAIAKQLTKDGTYGFLKSTDGNIINDIISTKTNRDSWLNPDGKSANFVNNQDLKAGYELLYNLMYTDRSMMTWEDMIVQKVSANESPIFFNKQAAMVSTGSHLMRNIKDVETFPRDFTVAFAETPSLVAGQTDYYANVNVQDHISINENSQYKEAAMEYIKWYYTEGYDPMIAGGRMPLYQGYDVDRAVAIMLDGAEDLVDVESLKRVFFGSYDQMQYDVNNPNKAEVAKIMREEMEAYFLQQYDIDTALSNMESRSNNVLAS